MIEQLGGLPRRGLRSWRRRRISHPTSLDRAPILLRRIGVATQQP
jgi:hypothetical protein